MKSKSELYLKNFELLNVEPVVSLSLFMDNDLNESSFRSILSLCKQWYIKNITIESAGVVNTQFLQYLQQSINDHYLFERNDFKFSFENNGISPELLKALLADQESLISPILINTCDYEIANRLWDKEFVLFTGARPEMYRIQLKQDHIRLHVPNAHHIKTVIAAAEMNFNSLTEITDWLDKKTGNLFCPWKESKEVTVFILRQIDGWITNQMHLPINYVVPLFWQIYQNFVNNQLGRHGRYFDSWTVGGIAKQCPVKHIVLHNKSVPADLKLLLTYWHPMEQTPQDIRTILSAIEKKAFDALCQNGINFKNRQYDTIINWNISALFMNEPYFEQAIRVAKCATAIQLDIDPFPMHTSMKKYQFIKLLVSLAHHYKKPDPFIRMGTLLNLNTVFEEQMWHLHWLLSLGLVRFNFQLKYVTDLVNNDFFNNIPTMDPSYKAYPEWFAYINQLAHFLKDGIHRCDVLILYPNAAMVDENTSNLFEINQILNQNAIDFDYVDIETFLDNKVTVFDGGKIYINQEAYAFLVLPQVATLPLPVLERIFNHFNSGGIVVAIGNLPAMQDTKNGDIKLKAISNNIWFNDSSIRSTKFKTNELNGKGYYQSDPKLLPDILLDNPSKLNFRIDSQESAIHAVVRETPNNFTVYLFNHNRHSNFKGTIITGYSGIPYIWNFERVESEPYFRWYTKGKNLHIPVTIPPERIQLFMIKKESPVNHIQISSDNLDRISSIDQNDRELKITGLVHKAGKYKINIVNRGRMDECVMDIDNHLPVLKISDKNWHVQFSDKKMITHLGDLCWYEPFYSGEIIYNKIILIPDEYLQAGHLTLSLGQLKNWVAVSMNEKNLGSSIVPLHEFDVTACIKERENLLTVKINNTLANRLSLNSVGNRGGFMLKEYGLFGPVRIIPSTYLTFKF